MSALESDLRENAAMERAAAWCVRLAEGRLPGDERAAFEAWLAEDVGNGARLERCAGAWQGVEAFASAPEMVSLRGEAMETARRAHRTARLGAFFTARERVAAAAVVLVIGVAALGAWGWRVAQPQVYATGLGERRVVMLGDGSRVSLDADTEVKVRFTGERRRVWLERGRARFDVTHNPLRPFSVQAQDEVVVDTGTSFSVELLRRQVRVVLYEGHVAVLHQASPDAALRPLPVGPNRASAEAVLTPGHELIAPIGPSALRTVLAQRRPAAVAPVATIGEIDATRARAWEGGQLVFDDEPLATAVQRVNRYSDRQVSLGDTSVGERRISGVFNAGDTAAFVDAATALLGLKTESVAGGVRLSAAPDQRSHDKSAAGS